MNDIKIIDLHTHTDNSPDGNHSAMYMAEIAEANGI
jgi:histidinol phosphatase-like PHP family hydrolase